MLYLKHPAQEVKYRKVWCAILIRLAPGRDPGIGTLVQRAGRGRDRRHGGEGADAR